MSLPPEEPTRPLGSPVGPAEPVYERERIVPADDPVFKAEVMDRLGALRVWAALATLLALLAIGLAAWVYFEEDDDGDKANRGNAVSAAEVELLEERIDALEKRPDQGVPASEVAALQEEQDALAAQVEELAAQTETAAEPPPAATEDAEARAAIETLDTSVADLDARVQALEQQAAP